MCIGNDPTCNSPNAFVRSDDCSPLPSLNLLSSLSEEEMDRLMLLMIGMGGDASIACGLLFDDFSLLSPLLLFVPDILIFTIMCTSYNDYLLWRYCVGDIESIIDLMQI